MKQITIPKRLGIIVTALLCMGLAAVAFSLNAAAADSVSYIYYNGNYTAPMTDSVSSYTTISSSTTTWSSGWYVVSGDVTISSRVKVSGDVKLILKDGCSLTASKGIHVYGDNSLAIYAQSTGENMGSLTANGNGSNAGIGSNRVGAYGAKPAEQLPYTAVTSPQQRKVQPATLRQLAADIAIIRTLSSTAVLLLPQVVEKVSASVHTVLAEVLR